MSHFDCHNDIIYLIRHLNKLLQNDFDERIAKYDLTGQQARLLFYINRMTNIENIEVHQNDIEREFHLAKSTVNGLISRLEKKEFIVKTIQNKYSILNITEKGISMIEELKEGRKDTIDRLFKGFSEEEKQLSISKLNILLDNFTGGNEDVAKN